MAEHMLSEKTRSTKLNKKTLTELLWIGAILCETIDNLEILMNQNELGKDLIQRPVFRRILVQRSRFKNTFLAHNNTEVK